MHEDWEFWESTSRPRMESRLATLQAADAAASPSCGIGDASTYLQSRQKRLSAAARKLVEIRRGTVNSLQSLDADITRQWIGVNSANTATAGLAVGSAAALFVLPPVGVALGLASAATGGATTIADLSVDHHIFATFREQMAKDVWNTIAVAELENDWLVAREQAGEALASCDAPDIKSSMEDLGASSARLIQVGATSATLAAEVVEEGLKAASTGASSAMKIGTFASRAFAVVGAVAAAGIAVHGWSTTKFSQQAVRAKLSELTSSLLYMQRWLAGLDDLECPICLEVLSLQDHSQRCTNWHYFHAECLQQWCQDCTDREIDPTCPECRGAVADDVKTLDNFIFSDMRTHLGELPV
jgi:hypothetical protein